MSNNERQKRFRAAHPKYRERYRTRVDPQTIQRLLQAAGAIPAPAPALPAPAQTSISIS